MVGRGIRSPVAKVKASREGPATWERTGCGVERDVAGGSGGEVLGLGDGLRRKLGHHADPDVGSLEMAVATRAGGVDVLSTLNP